MSIWSTLTTRASTVRNALIGVEKAPADSPRPSSRSQLREGNDLGPFAGLREWFVPRQVNASLYEALRECIPPLDAAINRLVTLDGIIGVEGENDKLVAEIQDWMDNVPVNDMEVGFQAFTDAMGGERYEQGCAIGEFITDAKGRDVVALRVADSKGVQFRREGTDLQVYYRPPTTPTGRGDGTDRVEQVLRGTYGAMTLQALTSIGFAPLDRARLVYQSINNEADNPYGVSIIRSCEFVAQILLTIQTATGNSWARYGDPPLSLTYKTKSRKLTTADLEDRQAKLANDLANAMNAKRKGNTADFVQAIGADDDIVIEVIGAQDKFMEIEAPARHVLEQIVAKTGLPSWMLGFHWSTAERLAEAQSIMVLQESRTRFARARPALRRIVETMLRLRGRTWNPKDWQLVQMLPSLQDELKRAQADFLRAQTELMLRGGQPVDPVTGREAEADKALQAQIDRIAGKLVGIDADALRKMAADPTCIDALIAEAMDA